MRMDRGESRHLTIDHDPVVRRCQHVVLVKGVGRRRQRREVGTDLGLDPGKIGLDESQVHAMLLHLSDGGILAPELATCHQRDLRGP